MRAPMMRLFVAGLFGAVLITCGEGTAPSASSNTKGRILALDVQQPVPEGYLGPPKLVPGAPRPDVGTLVTEEAPLLAVTILPNVLVNDKVDDAPDQTQSETTIAVDPTNPLRLVGGFNDCRGFFIPSRNGISGNSFSTNGAATWTPMLTGLPKGNPGHFGAHGDPSIDVDSAGNFYYANLYSTNSNPDVPPFQVSVHKGRFTGSPASLVWDPPTFVTTFTSGLGADKDHVGVDKRPGSTTVYVTYVNFTVPGNGQVEIARSTDGAATWSAPVVLAPGTNVVNQGPVPRVGPDGELYVAWEVGAFQPTRSIHIRKSTSWPTFGPDTVVADVTGTSNPPFNSRTNEFPTLAVDNTSGPNRGRVYVAWNDARFGGPGAIGAVLLSHSPSGAAGTWTAPVMLNDDGLPSATGTHHWFPWISVDPRGVLHAGWYDRRNRGTQADLTEVFVTDFTPAAGRSPNVAITSQRFSMNVPSRCTPNFGDYNGSAASPSKYFFLYGDGRLGNPDTFVAGVSTSPIQASPTDLELCRPNSATSTITVFGGPGLFESPVSLSLDSVTPPGSGITATFNPNPVPTPPPAGSNSLMTISPTASTPPDTYRLTVKGTAGAVSATTDLNLLVRAGAPTSFSLLTPTDGSDGVSQTPTFTWSAAGQASRYKVEAFLGSACQGSAVRTFDNIRTTSFTVPDAQSLQFFQNYSWRVTASNACGPTVSTQCFNFRTLSCGPGDDLAVNGGFEQDLNGWTVVASSPPPTVTTERPHSGAKAVRLGTLDGSIEPAGDSAISQTVTLPPAGGAPPALVFWYWPRSTDSVAFDQQYVRVTPINPPGPTVELMREANNAQTYIRREFSLADFSGKTIAITFGVHQDGFGDPTGMFVDDVAINASSCGPPDFRVTVVPPAFNEVCAGSSIQYSVGVVSVNGPNFTSLVDLSVANLPPGATATLARSSLRPGESTTLTLNTTRPTIGDIYSFDVVGVAQQPPPAGPRSRTTNVRIDANIPNAPERIAPPGGEVNVARRPTLSWTEPFVPDGATPTEPAPALVASSMLRSARVASFANDLRAPAAPAQTAFLWEMAANAPPGGDNFVPRLDEDGGPLAFGAARYRVQVATDAGFASLVVNVEVAETRFTVPVDLDIGKQYFWRVNATNACGTSNFSEVGTFIVGACFESWTTKPPVPITNGPAQASVVAAGGKIYVIGGGTGGGPDQRIDQVWEFNPAGETWSRKADVPAPGAGATFGSAAELGGAIYTFGGVNGPPGPIVIHGAVWKYSAATNTWTRLRDLPVANFGSAVAAINGKIYIAYGSGFVTQTWQYDPATDNYTRKADALNIPAPFRVHGAAIGSQMHVFAGGFDGTAHVVYDANTDVWRPASPMPTGVTDPAVAVLGGRFYVVGGRPTALTQIFDPATSSWSQGAQVTDAPTGVDNTAGAALGPHFHLVGGFTGSNSTNVHHEFKVCVSGDLTSAALIPFCVDSDGSNPDLGSESTSLLISNPSSGSSMSAVVFFYKPDGTVDSTRTFTVAPNELRTVSEVIRQLRGTSTVQNVEGSLVIFGTDAFNAVASIANNDSNDHAIEDGQSLGGIRNGFVPLIEGGIYHTQTVFSNVSSSEAAVELLAYPATGGPIPVTGTVVFLPPHGMADFRDVVGSLGLPGDYFGQLSFNSNQPLAVYARELTGDESFSGSEPVRSTGDGNRAVVGPYVEDTNTFSSRLEINNTGPTTASVTVQFFDVNDPTGGTPGRRATRDLSVRVNSATVLADIIRWTLRDASGVPSGKRGFIVVTSPQGVTAQATIINNNSLDPEVPDAPVATANSFTPLILRFEPFGIAQTTASRIGISNPGSSSARVAVAAFNADGTPARATPFVVQVAPGGQFFTEDIVTSTGLSSIFFGWMSISADAPVVLYNHRRTGDSGAVVPVHVK